MQDQEGNIITVVDNDDFEGIAKEIEYSIKHPKEKIVDIKNFEIFI